MIKKMNGFTLIELIVSVLVVAILSNFAINTYTKKIIEVRRAEGKSKLLEIMQRQEKYYSENNTYVTALTNLGYGENTVFSDAKYYLITATANDIGISDGVVLTAVPQGNQIKDTQCGSFILNSNGQRKTTLTLIDKCW